MGVSSVLCFRIGLRGGENGCDQSTQKHLQEALFSDSFFGLRRHVKNLCASRDRHCGRIQNALKQAFLRDHKHESHGMSKITSHVCLRHVCLRMFEQFFTKYSGRLRPTLTSLASIHAPPAKHSLQGTRASPPCELHYVWYQYKA